MNPGVEDGAEDVFLWSATVCDEMFVVGGGGGPPLCGVAGGLEAGIEGVEVIRQAVCGADSADGGPVVCDVHPPGVSSGIEAVQLLSAAFWVL